MIRPHNPDQVANFSQYDLYHGVIFNVHFLVLCGPSMDQGSNTSLTRNQQKEMEGEAKAKVVASVWGAEFVQLLAALGVLPRSIWKNRMN